MRTSISNNRTRELWGNFMRRRNEVQDTVSNNRYSVQIYSEQYFNPFHPDNEFDKWASMEVTNVNQVPEGMEVFNLASGLYAVFLHKGAVQTGPATFQYIFGTWLPSSGYLLDNRPHFEVLDERYRNDDPDSEEEIWIPVRLK